MTGRHPSPVIEGLDYHCIWWERRDHLGGSHPEPTWKLPCLQKHHAIFKTYTFKSTVYLKFSFNQNHILYQATRYSRTHAPVGSLPPAHEPSGSLAHNAPPAPCSTLSPSPSAPPQFWEENVLSCFDTIKSQTLCLSWASFWICKKLSWIFVVDVKHIACFLLLSFPL